MVKQVTAWEAEDGTLHSTRQLAADQDLRIALHKLSVFKGDTIEQIVQRRLTIGKLLNAGLTPDAREQLDA